MVLRVLPTGAEKESMKASIERHRDVVLWKLEGLDDEQLRRKMTASGTSLLGIVKHLAAVEFGWFCSTFGRPAELLPSIDYDADPESDMAAALGETTEEIVAYYERARAAANAVIDELDLDTTGTSWDGTTVSLRWVLIHMLEEVARHAGHMDIVRELIDNTVGDHKNA